MNKLTIKQSRFLDKYFETGNATESAVYAYNVKDRNSARALGAENLSKLSNVVRHMMEEHGLTLPILIKELKNQVKATKPFSSHTEPDREIPDNQARLKAIDIAGSWLGIGKEKTYGAKATSGDMSVEFIIHES